MTSWVISLTTRSLPGCGCLFGQEPFQAAAEAGAPGHQEEGREERVPDNRDARHRRCSALAKEIEDRKGRDGAHDHARNTHEPEGLAVVGPGRRRGLSRSLDFVL